MQLRQNVLEQIEQLLSGEYLTIPNVCFFMQSIRILLEIDQSQDKYRITSHYCNWLLHQELDRKNSPKIIIEEIANSFQEFSSKNDLIKKINNAISLKELVTQLKEILWHNIPNKEIVSQMDFEENWVNFINIVLHQVMLRPVKLKRTEISIEKFKFSIYGIQIVGENEKYRIELLSKELAEKEKRITVEIALFNN